MKAFASTLALALLVLTACTPRPQAPGTLSPLEASGLIRNDFAVLIDARAPEAKGPSAQGALRVPVIAIGTHDDAWATAETRLKGKQAVVYGTTAEEGAAAAAKLAELGFKASSIGSFDDWQRAGLPVTGQ